MAAIFADNIFKVLNAYLRISVLISQKFDPKGRSDNKSSLPTNACFR